MPDATLDHYEQLLTRAFFPTVERIMPAPHWGQGAAMLGSLIDMMRERDERMTKAVADVVECFADYCATESVKALDDLSDAMARLREATEYSGSSADG